MKIRKSHLFYLLVFLSAILSAVISGAIAIVNQKYIPDPRILGFTIFLVGIAMTFFIGILFSLPVKGKSLGARAVDPSFTRLRLLKREEVKYHFLAGIGNATYTLSYCALFSLIGDPSVVIPFVQVVILYLVCVESFTEKNFPTLVELQSAIIVTIGAILGSISLKGAFNLEAVLVVFLFMNPGWVLLSVYNRKLKRMIINEKHNDAFNIRFWNVFFSFIFIATAFGILGYLNGSSIVLESLRATIEYFWWIVVIASAALFGYLFYIRALGFGKASVTQALRSSTIIFAIPISILIASYNIIPLFSIDPVLVLLKVFGIILIVLGIVSYGFTQVKGFLFVKVKKGKPIYDVMKELWKLQGVTRVSATTGPYDLIAEVRTRSLYKGYEWIIRGIDSIKSIKHYQWRSILKEWENI